MLVLTRKPDQMIEIDQRITIKVLRVKGKSVRIGIEAPQDVAIRRSELSIEPIDVEAERLEHEPNALESGLFGGMAEGCGTAARG